MSRRPTDHIVTGYWRERPRVPLLRTRLAKQCRCNKYCNSLCRGHRWIQGWAFPLACAYFILTDVPSAVRNSHNISSLLDELSRSPEPSDLSPRCTCNLSMQMYHLANVLISTSPSTWVVQTQRPTPHKLEVVKPGSKFGNLVPPTLTGSSHSHQRVRPHSSHQQGACIDISFYSSARVYFYDPEELTEWTISHPRRTRM